MSYRQLATPWAARSRLYSAPGSAVVKLALGEAPESIPSAADVRAGALDAASQTRIRGVDRVLNHLAGRARISRVHTAAAALGRIGWRHVGFDDLEHALGLSRTFRIDTDGACAVDDLVDALRQVAVVEQASPQYLCTLPFAVPGAPGPREDAWAARRQVCAAQALAYEAGDPSVIVAVVDTGVVHAHSELADRLRAGIDFVQLAATSLPAAIELVGDAGEIDRDPEDIVGHGTACAAIIAARGLAMPPGLGGNCRVLPIRVLGAARFPGKRELSGVGSIADIDRGVKSAIDLGARIINMSFGTPESELDAYDPVPHADVVRYGLARNCIMIAASGNAGGRQRYSPASLDGVIAVGAADTDGRPAPFSTGGSHVDLAAPGVRVLSASTDGYMLVTGTSFAAPFVTAVAGLLASRAASRAFPLDCGLVKRILRESADRWPPGSPAGHGVGTLNAYAALRRLDQIIDREEYLETAAGARVGGPRGEETPAVTA